MKKFYTTEQKLQAIQMLEEQGPAEAKRILGIPSTTIYRWRNKMNPLTESVQDEMPDMQEIEIPEHEPDNSEEAVADNEEQAECCEDANQPEEPPADEPPVEEPHSESDKKDACVLGAILLTLCAIEQENSQLREDNKNLRKAMVTLLKGETHD